MTGPLRDGSSRPVDDGFPTDQTPPFRPSYEQLENERKMKAAAELYDRCVCGHCRFRHNHACTYGMSVTVAARSGNWCSCNRFVLAPEEIDWKALE